MTSEHKISSKSLMRIFRKNLSLLSLFSVFHENLSFVSAEYNSIENTDQYRGVRQHRVACIIHRNKMMKSLEQSSPFLPRPEKYHFARYDHKYVLNILFMALSVSHL